MTTTKKKTAKYPGWTIEKDGTGYLMVRDAGIYAVSVEMMGGEWVAELLVSRRRPGEAPSWEMCRNGFSGTAAAVTAEANRRAATMAH